MAVINATLAHKGLGLKAGTVVETMLIAAPSPTKKSSSERDPEMHQTRNGNRWQFGIKAHRNPDTLQTKAPEPIKKAA